MQICLYSGVFFPSVGGIEQVSYTLANYWVKQGHHVIVVTDTPDNGQNIRLYNFSVIRCPSSNIWNSVLNTSDVIISNGYSFRYLATWLLSRKPFIWIHQTYIPAIVQPIHNLKDSVRALLGRIVLPLADCNIYISCAVQRQVGGTKGVVIYNPVEAHFRKLLIPINNDFAFFGRMISAKGVDVLLKALAICKQKGKIYQIDLYGEGSSLHQLQELAQTLEVASQLRWYPFVQGKTLVEAMNAAGTVIVPSQWAEPMGVVAVEAMACAKAVIGSRRGGLGEVLKGYGMTFENGNAEELAKCMIEVKENPDLRLSLEEKCYQRAQDFSIDAVASKYLQIFESL